MTGARWNAGLLAGLVMGAALDARLAYAAAPRAPATAEPNARIYDIPPQALMSAVEDFAAATGIQVLYDRPPGTQPRSPGVRGLLTPEAALKRLLEGSGLAARFTDARSVVLAPIGSGPGLPPAAGAPPMNLPKLSLDPLKVEGALVLEASRQGGGGDLHLYGALIRNSIRQVLANNSKTSRGDYDAVLDLWIEPTGRIRRASRSAASSGDVGRDVAILAAVQGLALEAPPPPELPQPIRIGVRSRRP